MPDYTYRCNDCEWIFDVEKPLGEAEDTELCPTCGQPCDRVWTAPVIVFRGPDFTLALQAEEEPGPMGDGLCDGIEGLECLGMHVG